MTMQTTRLRWVAVPMVGAAVVAGLTACGGSSGGGNSGGGDLAAFCKEVKSGGQQTLSNISSNPKAGVQEFAKIASLAPAAISAQAQDVQNTLDAALKGKAPSNPTKLSSELKSIVLYAQKNCPGGVTGG